MTNDAPHETANPDRLPRNVELLGWASLLNDVASEMVFPLLPQFLISVLGGNRVHLGIIEGMAESAGSFVKLWSGHRSDKTHGRRGFVIFGYALAAIARPVMGLVVLPWQLFVLRVADRIGKGIRTSPRDAMIADVTDSTNRGRAFGFQRGMDHLGAALGPVLAVVFLSIWPDQLRVLFLLGLLPGLAVVGLVMLGVRERHVGTHASASELPATKPLGRNFRVYLTALIVFTFGHASDAFLLVRAGELGVPTMWLPALWCLFHVVKSVGNMVAGRFADTHDTQRMVLLSWLLHAAVYLAFALAAAAWHVWLCFVGYALFFALAEPAERTLVADLMGNQRRGLAYGWFNLAIGIAAFPSSLIFGVLYEQLGALVTFGWGATLSLVASLVLLAMRREPKRQSAS